MEAQGRDIGMGNPLPGEPRGEGLRESFDGSRRLMAQGPPDIGKHPYLAKVDPYLPKVGGCPPARGGFLITCLGYRFRERDI